MTDTDDQDNCQDGASAPIVENEYNSPTQCYNNGNEQITVNAEKPILKPINSDDVNINRNKNRRRRRRNNPNVEHIHLPNIKKVFGFILLSISIIDIIIQIIFGYVNLNFMIDDLMLMGLSSIIIYSDYKKKNIRNYYMAALTVIIWFGGAAIKGFGLTNFEFNGISITLMLLIFIRTGILFCYIPISCP